MKKQVTSFFAGVITTVLIGSLTVSALAISSRMTIEVDPVSVQVNGKVFKPTDANGAEVPVFAYNGTTYAPLRALAEAYGLDVWYDSTSNLASVGAKGSAPVTPSQVPASLNYESVYIAPGETITLNMPNADNKHISWTSSDPEYIRVSNGVVSVFKNGGSVATITATTEDGISASCIVMMKSTDEVVKKFTSINVYKKFPAIPSFDNISPSTPLWHHFDISIPEYCMYDYHYVYLISNLDDAEYLAKEYAYWLKSLNYTLIREEDDPILVQSEGSDIIYELSDPTNRYVVSVKGEVCGSGYCVDVSIDYSKSMG